MMPIGFLLMAILIAVRLIAQGGSSRDTFQINSDH
jgi:hypothetical protein